MVTATANDVALPSSLQPSSALSSSPQSPKVVKEKDPIEEQSPTCIPNGEHVLDNNCSPVSSLVGVTRPLTPAVAPVKSEIQHEDVTDDDDEAANIAVKSEVSPVIAVNGFRSTVEDITDDEELELKPVERETVEIKTEIKTEVEECEVKEETDAEIVPEESDVVVKTEVKTEDDDDSVIKAEVMKEEGNESLTEKGSCASVSEDPPGKKGLNQFIFIYCVDKL